MEAIVLAGGFGTRLRTVVSDVPKPMAPIAGRPYLEILLSRLAQNGFKRVILSLGYMADTIVKHFGDAFMGMTLVYEIEDLPLGTGGAVRVAMMHCQNDHVFVFNGDTYLDLDVDLVERQYRENGHSIIVGRRAEDTARYGRLLIDGIHITGFSEKGVSGPGLINGGVYILPSDALNHFEIGHPFSLEADYFAVKVDDLHLEVFATDGYFIDIGIPEDYARAQKTLANV